VKKRNLSAKEIKSLLMAKNDVQMSIQKTLNKKIGEAVRQEMQLEESPERVAIRNGFTDQVLELIANRLSENQQDTPLCSSSDLLLLTSAVINMVETEQGYELDADERRLIERLTENLFKSMLEMIQRMVPGTNDMNPYVEYWRWIDAVLDLSAERGVPATEIVLTQSYSDEITRRLCPKEQFLAKNNKDILDKFSAEKLKESILFPILNAMIDIGEDDEDDEDREDREEREEREEIRQEMEEELEKEVMPQVRLFVEAAKNVIKAWIDDEIERIYA